MHPIKPIVVALLGTCMLSACIGPGTADERATLRVQPLSRVEHAGGNDARSWYRMGRELYGRGELEQARAAYVEALGLQPKYADAHSALGVVYAALGRQDDAVRAFQAAIALSPADAYLYNNLGYAYLLQGSNAAAESAFRDALRVDPSHAGAQINLLVALRRQGKTLDTQVGVVTPPTPTPVPVARQPEPRVPMHNIVGTPLPPEPPAGNEAGLRIELVNDAAPVAAPAPTPVHKNSPLSGVIPAIVAAAATPSVPNPVRPRPQVAPRRVVVEVINSSGVNGVARSLASRLDRAAYVAQRVTRGSTVIAGGSEVRYRAGYRRQALELAARIPGAVRTVESRSLHDGAQISLVLGSHAAGATAAPGTVVAGNI